MMLEGKVAVITGAGPGLGRTLATLMAREGADIVIAARSADTLEATAAEVSATGPTALAVPAQVRALAKAATDRFGRVDVLVNAAFPGTHRTNVLDMDDACLERWRSAVETAAYGTLLACRHIAPHMVAAGRGAIVNI